MYSMFSQAQNIYSWCYTIQILSQSSYYFGSNIFLYLSFSRCFTLHMFFRIKEVYIALQVSMFNQKKKKLSAYVVVDRNNQHGKF